MRVVRREAERAIDPRLQLLRDDVLEAVGFVVDVVVFKSNGLAAWDVAIGAMALERARAAGVGREL